MTIESPLKNLLTRKEAADYLYVSVRTMEIWASTKRYPLKFYKVGRTVAYKKEDLDKFIESRVRGV